MSANESEWIHPDNVQIARETPRYYAALMLASDADGAPEICDLCKKLERENAELRAILLRCAEKMESLWSSQSNGEYAWSECPDCYGDHNQHKADCEMNNLTQEARKFLTSARNAEPA